MKAYPNYDPVKMGTLLEKFKSITQQNHISLAELLRPIEMKFVVYWKMNRMASPAAGKDWEMNRDVDK